MSRARPGACSFPVKGSCVYLVGAGPGDPGLLTVKALCLINRADVVVYDRLVSDEVMQQVPAGVSRIFVGKQNGDHCMPQDEINALLVRLARTGRRVVRLKGGDPFIFGRGGEEAQHLVENRIDFEVVPGVTAATACAAYSGIPLTHRDFSRGVVFFTGHGKKDTPLEQEIAEHYAGNKGATLVVYMGLARIEAIMTALLNQGMQEHTPVALIEQGTTRNHRRVLTTAATAHVDAAELKAPTLIVIGEVVRLAKLLDWFVPAGQDASTLDAAGQQSA